MYKCVVSCVYCIILHIFLNLTYIHTIGTKAQAESLKSAVSIGAGIYYYWHIRRTYAYIQFTCIHIFSNPFILVNISMYIHIVLFMYTHQYILVYTTTLSIHTHTNHVLHSYTAQCALRTAR